MSTAVQQPTYSELVQIVRQLHHRVLALEVAADGGTGTPVEAPSSAPYAPGSATSRRAAQAVEPRIGSQKRTILDYLIEQGDTGATRQEIAAATGFGDDTVRPRVLDLIAGGWVAGTNFTRPTPKGGDAEVVVATVHARREATLRTEQVRHAVSPAPVLTDEPGAVQEDLLGGELPAPGSSVSTGRPSMYDTLGDAA